MRLLILYGSQTGTAQDVAEQIWRESKQWGFSGPVLAADDYSIQDLVQEKLVVFVIATTGDGEMTDNMQNSWRFLLRKSLPLDSLKTLSFACLGLGDSSYAKYNFAAKKLNKRLLQLGATPLIDLGLCDDQHDHGLGAVALPWMAKLWINLSSMYNLERIKNISASGCKFIVSISNQHEASNLDLSQLSWNNTEVLQPFVVQKNLRTTAMDHFQDVRLISMKFEQSAVSWSAGDILTVRPINSQPQIDDFFLLLREHNMAFDEKTMVTVISVHEDMPIPAAYRSQISIRQLVTHAWDLNAKPRQRVFELLAQNCNDELEKEKLLELASFDGLDDLIQYVNRPRRTILEVLHDFRHATAKLTLNLFFEIFTLIQSRSFSIASMPQQGTLDVLVAVVEYKTKLSTPRLGLCSNWLKGLSVGQQIWGVIRKGTMNIPSTKPLIMVGPGTGIAPFRSIVQEKKGSCSLTIFFGCRNKCKDFHFQTELEQWQKEQSVDVRIAFSRDQEDKVYVQHLIRQYSDKLRELIRDKNAVILIAGSSKNMPKQVKEAFCEVLKGDNEYLEKMIKEKRYQEETWS